jgi:TRAP-type C4-dicarboxylate transport system permease small subunit
MLSKAIRATDTVARCAVWAGGAMLVFASFMVAFEVVARRFFGFTIGGADEISGYLFAVSTSWAFAFVLLHRGNVRIDALYVLLPRKLCALLDLLALLTLGLFMVLLTHGAYEVLLDSMNRNARSVTPLRTLLAVPQSFWLAGLLLFQVAYVLVLLKSLTALFRGDYEEVGALIGVPSLDEELPEHLQAQDAPRRGN